MNMYELVMVLIDQEAYCGAPPCMGHIMKGVMPESYLVIFDLTTHINLQTHNVKVEAVGLFAKKQRHSCRAQKPRRPNMFQQGRIRSTKILFKASYSLGTSPFTPVWLRTI